MPCAYIGRPKVFPYFGLTAVNLSLRHGNAEDSCFAYSVYGFMLAAVFGEIPAGFAFSEMSIRLNERFGDAKLRGTLLHLHGDHINFWCQHFRTGLPILEQAFQACLAVGDLVYGSFLAFETVWQRFECGEPIAEVRRHSERFLAFAADSKNDAVFQTIRLEQQFLASLTGHTRGPGRRGRSRGRRGQQRGRQIEQQLEGRHDELPVARADHWRVVGGPVMTRSCSTSSARL
jgi:predicted ATPase